MARRGQRGMTFVLQAEQRFHHASSRAPRFFVVVRQLPTEHRQGSHAEHARERRSAEGTANRPNLLVVHDPARRLHRLEGYREHQLHQGEALGEIQTELAALDQRPELAVGGGDDARLSVLVQKSQEARLHQERKLVD